MTASPFQHRRGDIGDALIKAFPARAIVIQCGGMLHNTLMWAGLTLLFVTLGVFSVYPSLPDIISDARMKSASDIEIDATASVQGSCRRMKFIFIDCNATIRYQPDPASAEVAQVSQSFLFLGTSAETTVDVLRSKTHPRQVTTLLATSRLSNRIFTLLVMTLLFGTLSTFVVREGWASAQRRRMEGKAVRMRPVIASLVSTDEHGNVSFEAQLDGKTVKSSNRLRDGDLPLYLPSNHGQVVAVAIAGTCHLILLDEQLSVLGLSDSERAQIKAALG